MAFCSLCVSVWARSTACQLCSWRCPVVGQKSWTQTPAVRRSFLPHVDATVWKDLQVCFIYHWDFSVRFCWSRATSSVCTDYGWNHICIIPNTWSSPFELLCFNKRCFRPPLNLECPRREATTMNAITFAGQLEPLPHLSAQTVLDKPLTGVFDANPTSIFVNTSIWSNSSITTTLKIEQF